MPLPSVRIYGARQCRARAKHSKQRCLNPAAYGMPVCRFHGARQRDTVLKGKDHPNYQHGKQTQATRERNHQMSLQLAELEEIGFAIGMLQGERTRGRKPVK